MSKRQFVHIKNGLSKTYIYQFFQKRNKYSLTVVPLRRALKNILPLKNFY